MFVQRRRPFRPCACLVDVTDKPGTVGATAAILKRLSYTKSLATYFYARSFLLVT